MNLYKKCMVKPYSSLVNDITLISDNPFRCNLLEIIQDVIMTIYDKFRDEKLQYNSNRDVAKIFIIR